MRINTFLYGLCFVAVLVIMSSQQLAHDLILAGTSIPPEPRSVRFPVRKVKDRVPTAAPTGSTDVPASFDAHSNASAASSGKRFAFVAANAMDMRRSGVYILPTLLPRIKGALDRYWKLPTTSPAYAKPWASCAVVGNSGTMLGAQYADMIDANAMVMRMNNAPKHGFEEHVGRRTTVAFINGHRIHHCASQPDCPCYPYGYETPIITYLWEQFHYEDLKFCRQKHPREKFIVLDGAMKDLSTRMVALYSRRLEDEALQAFQEARERGEIEEVSAEPQRRKRPPEYSSGLEAVLVSLALCHQVNIYGFGKRDGVQHHYWENTTLHEYGFRAFTPPLLFLATFRRTPPL
ncbi:hypothetical protein CYMTET_54339 [Cymbomonas tetramitiformis]|uniref:Uncharacterized protein n=1 Tax=Cymbomonas tetramitiformis TaxID=36881 RepID=A0AAE0BGJ6_9CHLO|nr:hypothetical protein CYMTET_54339 [Cymbomonas tetramitiformis]